MPRKRLILSDHDHIRLGVEADAAELAIAGLDIGRELRIRLVEPRQLGGPWTVRYDAPKGMTRQQVCECVEGYIEAHTLYRNSATVILRVLTDTDGGHG